MNSTPDNVYIAGPIRGNPDFRKDFRAAAEDIVRHGGTPLNPAENPANDHPEDTSIMWDALDLLREANGIYLLDGWQSSQGARIEAALGMMLGMWLSDKTRFPFRLALTPILFMDEYQDLALRTMAQAQEDPALQTAGLALKLAGEAGEYADDIGKWILQGHDKPGTEELGDTLWYIGALANDGGARLSSLAGLNIDKLRRRYPDGFSTERSTGRERG